MGLSSFISPAALPTRRGVGGVQRCARRVVKAVVTQSTIASKSYQLEEMEDEATSTSAIYLAADGTLSLGQTDGPAPDRFMGTWLYMEDSGELTMEIERWFGEGEVPFCVKRILRGHIDSSKNIGNLPLFAGAMYKEPTDFDLQEALGHFAMVQANDDLPDANFDISKS